MDLTAQPASAATTEYTPRQRLDAERVRQLYALMPTGLAVTLLVALVTVLVLWNNANYGELSAWMLVTTLITAGRYVLYRSYLARPREPDVAQRWENRFAVGAGLAGTAWGALVVAVQPADVTYEVLFVLIGLGMAASAAGLLAPSYRSLASFIVPLAAGQIAKALLVGDAVHLAMAAFGLIYLLFLWRIAFDYHRMLVDTYQRHVADDDLLREQQRIFNSSAVGIAVIKDRAITTCNTRLAELFGYAQEDLYGGSTRVLFGSDAAWEAHSEEVATVAGSREICQFEERLVHRDGVRIWCLLQGRAANPADMDAGTILTVSDINSLKSVEATLRDSRDQYELVVRASQGGVWDWDIVGKRTYYSPQFKAILGHPPEADFEGLFFFEDALHPEDRERMTTAQASHLEEGLAFDHEFRLRARDGGYVWVRGRGQAIWNAAGQATRFAGSIIDMSGQRRIEEALHRSEAHYRNLVETSKSLVWTVDAKGVYTYVNDRGARTIFGYESAEMCGRPFTDFLVPGQAAADRVAFARLMAGEHVFDYQSTQRRRDGQPVILTFNAIPLRDEDGNVIGATGTAMDITLRVEREQAVAQARAAAEEARTMLRSAVESLPDGFAWFDRDDHLVLCNRRYAEIYTDATSFEELAGMAFEELVRWSVRRGEPMAEEFDGDVEAWVAERARRHRTANGASQRYQMGDGRWIQVTERRTPDGGIVGVRTDITELKKAEEEIRLLASLDVLTGLPNRRLLEDRLRQAIGQARRRQQMIAVMLIDLDNFKPINDLHGHRAGDAVLVEVARRLLGCVRTTDTVARYGGDEFVVILPDQQQRGDAEAVAAKIHAAIALPLQQPVPGLRLSCSIGVALFPEHGDGAEALLKEADDTMYRSKRMAGERPALH